MPRLTPAELQEARRQSGRLGGRPRKPTIEEARAKALEALVPRALQVLAAHLGDPDDAVNPDAWRAALRVFEHAYGRAPEQAEIEHPGADSVETLSPRQRDELRSKLLALYPGLGTTS